MTDHTPAEPSPEQVPPAIVEPRHRGIGAGLVVWLVPAVVACVVAIVAWRAWSDRGIDVVVEFDVAHGLGIGDPVRSFGIEIGRVRAMDLAAPASGGRRPVVRATLAIEGSERDLLREDTTFWIEHPRVDFGGVGGLDTITGPRYVGMDPGRGEPATGPWVGLVDPPVADSGVDGLRILIVSAERSGMRTGGAVTYRGVQIGRILEVGLAEDATRVEAGVLIEARFVPIVRRNSRFFSTSGIGFELGFDGLRADVESLESMVAGGIGIATPDRFGEPVEPGTRFQLAERAESNWLEWDPEIELGDD